MTIDPTDNKTVWVGTGEANPRNDVSYGDGIYKTTDGGDTWTNVGLKATKYISRILVDPRNHNHVVVAALGDVFSDSAASRRLRHRRRRKDLEADAVRRAAERRVGSGDERAESERGLRRHLEVSTAPVDVRQRRRRRWALQVDRRRRDVDEARRGTDCRTGTTGRIGLAVAPSDGQPRLRARSNRKTAFSGAPTTAANNWTMVSKDTLVDQRAVLLHAIVTVDPKNPDRVYAVSSKRYDEHRRRQDVQGDRRQRARRLTMRFGSRRTIRRASWSVKTAATR